MSNILITGGAGFVGSELGKHLIKLGHNVQLFDNLEYGYRDNFEDNNELAKSFILADVRDTDFHKYLNEIEIVFHFAGISALPECETNPVKALEVNTTSVANVLHACRKSRVRKFIFASTSAVYENNDPTTPFREDMQVYPNLIYATSKYNAEQICKSFAQNYDMDIVICRFFNVFGPHQDYRRKYPPFTSYLVREIIAGHKPTVFNTADVKRDYIYIQDLLEYLLHIMNSPKQYYAEIFNLGSGYGFSAIEIVNAIFDIMKIPIDYATGDPSAFWDKYDNLFNGNYNLSRKRICKEVYKHCIADIQKTVNEFSFSPQVNLINGLKSIIQFQQHK
ncbi:MAG: NAD-dependent epimerase/dehydratase family protein [Planctomycetaceae bacterium]|jgi:nucleoside-diphosphate-sugar epimerase|nr:NAD-dependent epimerase/dehydratase family protein [Planctomycetaceae bacterium]